MSRINDRLAELGLTLPTVAVPVAAYVPAVLDGDHVWVSGQLPFVDGVLERTGRVGTNDLVADAGETLISPDDATDLARICALNAFAAIGSVVELDRIERIVKVGGFVASHPRFTGQPGVINGASMLFAELLGNDGVHARAAVGVASLPLGAPVEVELVARVRP